MTLREICDMISIDKNPIECAFVIASSLRTILQGEPSTIEGECATILAAEEEYGSVTDPSSIRLWLDRLGPVSEANIPDRILRGIVEANQSDIEGEFS